MAISTWLIARVCLLLLLLVLPAAAVVVLLYALLLLGAAAAVLGVLILVCRKVPSRVLGEGGRAADSGGSPLRVAFVHPDLGIGGAERLIVDAAVGLQKRGHGIVLYTAHHDAGHCFEETRDGTLAVVCVGDWLPKRVLGRCYAACGMMPISRRRRRP